MWLTDQKFKTNWWLWVLISLPIGIYFLFSPHDRGGDWVISDWNYLTDVYQSCGLNKTYFKELGDALLNSFGLPIVIGWFAQFLIMFFLEVFKLRRHHAQI